MEKIYSRTKTIQEDKVSGFCPGCMHSTVVKLIGEVLEELNVVDKAVMITGVGCCGLHMDYIAYLFSANAVEALVGEQTH